jgi:hypothetical protein
MPYTVSILSILAKLADPIERQMACHWQSFASLLDLLILSAQFFRSASGPLLAVEFSPGRHFDSEERSIV